jgi:hypothetical protein
MSQQVVEVLFVIAILGLPASVLAGLLVGALAGLSKLMMRKPVAAGATSARLSPSQAHGLSSSGSATKG